MRICHIITGLETGGAERMLLKLLSATDRSRFESIVISLLDEGSVGADIKRLGVTVHALKLSKKYPKVSCLWQLRQAVRCFRPNLIQGWMYHGNLAALLAAGFMPGRLPVVWNIRQSLDEVRAEKPLTRALIHLSARLSRVPSAIIHNSGTGALQHEQFGFSATRRQLIPNGFDTNVFAPSSSRRTQFRSSLGIGNDEFVLGLAARYHPMKDINNFCAALTRLLALGYAPRGLLAGPGMDSTNRPLMEMLRTHQLTERVTVLGALRDMPLFFQSLDLATLSSCRGEGFPNVLGEAMACGIPCVATDVGDVGVILGDTGSLVSPGDPDALAGAWAGWMERGSASCVAEGRRARQRIVSLYTLPVIVQRYEDLYRALAEEGGE